MAGAAQVLATRLSAPKSTGLRTAPGNAVAAPNAFQPGLPTKDEHRIERRLCRTMGGRPFNKLSVCLEGHPNRVSSRAKQSQLGRTGSRLPEEVGRGHPTHRGPPQGGTPNMAEAIARNKANSREPSHAESQLCETNPISENRPAGPGPAAPNKANWRLTVVQTKPMTGRSQRQTPCGVTTNPGPSAPNKAN